MKPPSAYFKDPALYQSALIHRSYCNEHPGSVSNERLEFLGDSVLSLIISERLYRLYPGQPEGELTARRSLLVQTTTLATKAKELHLDDQLLLSKGEQELGGRQNTGLLANTFEAVLGALYLDSGLEVCREYLNTIFLEEEIMAVKEIKDPKSLLQELIQAQGEGTPIYNLLESSGPDHAKSFTVGVSISGKQISTGSGPSKQKAETEAAKSALSMLK